MRPPEAWVWRIDRQSRFLAQLPISSAWHRRAFLYVRNRRGDWLPRGSTAPA